MMQLFMRMKGRPYRKHIVRPGYNLQIATNSQFVLSSHDLFKTRQILEL